MQSASLLTNILDRIPHALDGFGSFIHKKPEISSANAEIDAWCFTEDEISGALKGSILLNPSIDLSNPCNLNCPYCFIEEKDSLRKVRRPNELTIEETTDTISDFVSAGARTVNLVGAGEPTIDPQFRRIVARIHELGARTLLFTNGVRIGEEPDLAAWLRQHGVSVILKYNSGIEKIQDQLVGQSFYSKKRNRALQLLLEEGFAATSPTRLGFDALALKTVREELPVLYLKCRQLNIMPLIADYIPTGRTEAGWLEVSPALKSLPKESPKLYEPLDTAERVELHGVLRVIDTELGLTSAPEDCAYYGRGTCTQILGVYVDIQGSIWPCVAKTQIILGSKRRKPLGNIRAGDRASVIWRTDTYLDALRASFSGGCPYKRPLPVLSVGEKNQSLLQHISRRGKGMVLLGGFSKGLADAEY